jgi:pectate lyase
VLRKLTVFVLGPLALIALLATALTWQLVAPAQKAHAAPADPLVGFGAGTTGGAGGPTVTVTTLSAFESAVSDNNSRIVMVNGMFTISSVIQIGSNKSIIGVGTNSGFTGSGLEVENGNGNVIFQNLVISYAVGQACIRIHDGNHIWIDHNTLFTDLNHGADYYDGLINITKGSDDVTVSWNILEDDYETSLIGASDSDGSLDIGHEKVTFHHNWFLNDQERTPSLRFGTGHVYNNYFENVANGVHSRMGAQMLIENNVWRSSGVAITTTGSSTQDGFANTSGNDYGGATLDITQVGTFTQAPYSYTLDPTSSVISEVTTYAGVIGGVAPTPTPTTAGSTPTPTPTRGTTPTPTPTRGTTPTPTVTTGSSCSVHYAITTQWSGGFSASFTITNTGSTAINGWSLQFSFPNGQAITQIWNGSYTQSGSAATITNVSYNGSISPGQSPSSEPGFNGTWNNTTNNAPTSFTLNGVSCSVV